MTRTLPSGLAVLIGFLVMCGAPRAGEDVLFMKSRPEILLPPDSDALAWRYDMKMGSLAGSCAGLLYDFHTPGLIERRVKEMANDGLNTIIINGLHMHHCFLHRWPRVTKFVQKLAEIAHQHDMKVVFHHDVPVVLYNGTGLQHLLEHKKWLARDIEHDRPTLRCYCIVNPEFREAYFDRMERFVRDTDIDGGMLDEACFAGQSFCGCEHCRTAFTEHTGLVLPRRNTSEIFHNRDHPIWIAWLKWRKRAVGDWWVGMRKRITRVKRDFCFMLYTTHYGFSSNWASKSSGSDLCEAARGCDFLGTEIMARNVYDSCRAVYAFRKAKTAVGDHFGIPIWGLVYHVDDPTFAYFGWAMNHMNRQATWMSTIEGENMGRYLDWPGRMKSRFATTVSDVAICFSTDARDLARMFSPHADPIGASECLTDAHIQHDFILGKDLLDKRRLSRYKLVILASIGVLSADQTQTLREYVAEGGALLATTNASLLGELGFLQPTFQLADVMGVDYVRASNLRGPLKVRMRADGSVLSVPSGAVRVKARNGAEIVADFLSSKGKPFYPAIVTNQYGHGHGLYFANAIGAMNYEREWGSGRKMTFEKNRAIADLFIQFVRKAATGPLDFNAVKMPEKVIANVCRQDVNGEATILVHLLNATGAGVRKGETVPLHKDWQKHGPAFPPLQEDLVFDIRVREGVARASVVSPDYEGERPVKLTDLGNGCLRAAVSREDLHAYSIVYLRLR